MRVANSKRRHGHYVFLDTLDRSKNMNKLGVHAEGPYRVLENATRKFSIQREPGVGRVNSEHVTRYTPPMYTAPINTYEEIPTTTGEKHRCPPWLIQAILGHPIATNGQLELQVDSDGPYDSAFHPWTRESIHFRSCIVQTKRKM